MQRLWLRRVRRLLLKLLFERHLSDLVNRVRVSKFTHCFVMCLKFDCFKDAHLMGNRGLGVMICFDLQKQAKFESR